MKLSIAVSPRRRRFAAVPLQGDIGEMLSLAKAIGFNGVELNMGHPNEVDAAILKDSLRENGLEAVSIATGAAYFEEGLCLSADAAGDRQKAVDRLRLQCDFAAGIGAMVVVGIMRGRLDADDHKARRQRDWFAESLEQCAAGARDAGTKLLLEPMNRYETNFIKTVAEALEFLDSVGRTDVLIMPDTFHMNIEEVDLPGALRQAVGRIGVVQTVDSNRRAPGMGHIDFAALLKALAASGYAGFLSAEVVPEPDGATAGRSAHAHLRPLLQSAGMSA